MASVDFADDEPVCELCKGAAVWINGAWRHRDTADAVFCSIFRTVESGVLDTE